MASKRQGRALKQVPLDNRQLLMTWMWVLGGLILLGGLWAWYNYLHRGAYNVFWDSIDNNLNTYGVTRMVEQTNNGAQVNQKLQLTLGAQNAAKGVSTVTQTGQDGSKTVIITETLGTPNDNYARYIDIQSPEKKDIASIKNVWSKELLVRGPNQNQSVFAEGLFASIPFANLNQSQRQGLIQYMKENKVYDVDYRGAKVVERAGKQGFEYSVKVNLKGYIEVLKRIDSLMGLRQMDGADPGQYDGVPPAQLKVVQSIDGRQLLEVTYEGASRKETYSGYGARVMIEAPETNLMRSDLEQKVQSLFGGGGA